MQIAVQFSFDGAKYAGDDVQLICALTQGSLSPNSAFHWTFQGHSNSIEKLNGIEISRVGSKSSMLTIIEVDVSHAGLYSCIVSNQNGGNVSKSLELVVHGMISWRILFESLCLIVIITKNHIHTLPSLFP